MAATKGKLTKSQQDQVRSAIQTTQLVKRLQCYALDQKDDAGNIVDLDSGRLRSIEVLLKKTLPDLSAVTIAGDPENPLKTEEVGQGASKLASFIETIAERSRATSEPE